MSNVCSSLLYNTVLTKRILLLQFFARLSSSILSGYPTIHFLSKSLWRRPSRSTFLTCMMVRREHGHQRGPRNLTLSRNYSPSQTVHCTLLLILLPRVNHNITYIHRVRSVHSTCRKFFNSHNVLQHRTQFAIKLPSYVIYGNHTVKITQWVCKIAIHPI